jgi:PAS domain S-box-containing protein
MNAVPTTKKAKLASPEEISRDAMRIAAEIASAGHGTDPFAEAVRATRMPMVITDPRLADNPIVFANDAFCRLSGYERGEILGRNCRFLQGPETDPDVVEKLRVAVQAGAPVQVDILNNRKSGEKFWNRLLMAPVRDGNGELAYYFASQVDVTIERERLAGLETHNAALMAEVAGRLRAQQEGEARLRFATQAGKLGIWELDLRNFELNASAMFKEHFGRDPASPFSHDDLLNAVHPDDRERVEAAKAQAIANGTEYDIEYRVVRPGGIGWVQIRAQLVRAIDGSALRLAGISLDTTERRNAELRLQLSEESLRLATDAAEVGTWDVDLTTDQLFWPARTKAMFGISPDVPCTMADFYAGLHPDDLAATTAAFAGAIDPDVRATYDVEYRTIGKEDGVVRWVAAKGKGLFEDQKCVRALGTAMDITARRAAAARQAFLLGLWDRLRTLTTPQDIMTAAVTALGRHLGASRVGYGQVQADDETIVFDTVSEYGVLPAVGAYPLAGLGSRNVARQRLGETVVCADVNTDPDQEGVDWAASQTGAFVAVPMTRDGALRVVLYVTDRNKRGWSGEDVALIEDVAARTWDAVERARAEAALRVANESLEAQVEARTEELQESQARLRTIFETSYQFQGLIELDGTMLDANATSLDAIEARLEDVIGKKFWDTPWFTGTPGIPELIRGWVERVADGATLRQELTLNLPSGERSFDVSLRPIRDMRGEVTAMVPEAVETTERRRTEAALRQAQKMEAVGQLTGGIAHDFNNLLAGIMGSLELLQRRLSAGRIDGVDRYSAAAITSAQRASALTQRLLAFARRQPLDPKMVDANRLVASMEDLLRRTLGPGIALEMVLAGGLWPTMSDPNQLESAILNLAINARDAMTEGGSLTIETGNAYLDDAYCRAQGDEVRPGQYVQVSVTDTGTGMTPDVIAKAFDPFFTTKPTGQGTGLGLSMVYGFVKQSDGHVRIYSENGSGTTFKIYLPRHRGRVGESGDESAAAPAAAFRAEAGETVLVVDDEPTVRMLVMETLEDLGYAAIEANDGPAGLAILQTAARVDLLVTDVGLPGLNGRQLADAARVTRPGLKVLFVTGYAHNAAIGQGAALEPGMEIMTKPFALDDIAKKIRDMIEQ